MRTRSLIVAAVCGVTILGWALGHGSGPAVAARECPSDVGAANRDVGVAAVQNARVVGAAAVSNAGVALAPGTAVRQVTSSGEATAYVEDRGGADAIVLSTAHGTRVLPQSGEAYHPTWSPDGAVAWGVDDRLVVRSGSGERTIAGPQPGGIMFAPVFDGRDIVAAVSAAPTAAVPEDEWSDDLWLLRGGRWHRLTAFGAGTDRWSAIRTPFLAADGSVEFVVVQGRGSQDVLPRFSLWRARGTSVHRVAPLDDERYLAGYAPDGARLWNVPDRATETWLIQRETPNGPQTVGCGAVAVDPMDVPDPDRTADAAPTPHFPASERTAPTDPGDPMEAALLIGDFPSQVAANVVAQQVTAAYGGSMPVDVVQGGKASTIVQPDRWAVVVRLAATTDGTAELSALQTKLPDYADHMWVVVP
ncbi:MAG TPA: hypothetical protein VJ736_11915 [Actinomycetota bacterium]|jgi:hypothetical protein|nr:hypothetical protein [Actinomycetota bacterium]